MPPKILKDGTVITFDEVTQCIKILPRASVLITDGRIDAIEEDFTSLSVPPNTEIIDISSKILTPGFVNTHVHTWQAVYRSICPNVTLSHYFAWLSPMSQTAFKAFTADDIYISCLEGYLEGLNAGVTAYVDHAHHNWKAGIMRPGWEAARDAGGRVWWCWDVREREGYGKDEQWEELRKIKEKGKMDLVKLGLSYDGLVGAEGEGFKRVKREVKDLDIEAITIHHLGGPWPGDDSAPTGIHNQGLRDLNVPVIFSHAPYLSEKDMKILRDDNFHVSITPESEYHFGHGQTTGHHILDQGSLGVDTQATFSGDVLFQARLYLQKVRDTNFQKAIQETGLLARQTPMKAEEAFLLATRQGGRSLWRDDIGIIKVGAKADLVVFNGESPNMLGWSDPVAAVMLHANVGDIEHVLVDGEFKKRDFRLVNLKVEWEEVQRRFLEAARRIQPQAFPPPPNPENFWGTTGLGDVEVVSTIRK